MSAEIVKLERSPDGNLVATIERLLALARDGEIDSVAYATVGPGGLIGSGYSVGADQSFRMIASTLRLLRRVERFTFGDQA